MGYLVKSLTARMADLDSLGWVRFALEIEATHNIRFTPDELRSEALRDPVKLEEMIYRKKAGNGG